MSSAASSARDRLVLALDVDDLVAALRLARRLSPYFGVAKVGLELFSAAGPETVSSLVVEGYRVFVDLKLHDIPTTVGRAARVLGGLGAAYATAHAAGGEDMLRAAVEGIGEGASAAGAPTPCLLGVTVLTSAQEHTGEIVGKRALSAASAGCAGVVCAASDLEVVREVAPGLIRVVPGIRPSGVGADDQVRPSEPSEALRQGADLLVVGRAVTAASDPEAAAAGILHEVENALTNGV